MSDFDPPFGENGELRAPDSTEQSLGIPCGPFDLAMHNYLHNLSQGQIKNIADEAGVASLSEGDKTVLFRAVEALIDASTGGNPAGYVLMSQARARLPIYPEVLNTDGRIVVTSPSTGTVRIPGGVDFLHRGIFSVTTAQTDLSTDASKIYHLRWNPTDGFALKDLASGTYNPSSHDETHTDFDSDYEDMLVARVVTNSSNVATITNLSNKSRLAISTVINGTDPQGAGTAESNFLIQETFNWARTPNPYSLDQVMSVNTGNMPDQDFIFYEGGGDVNTLNVSIDRYQFNKRLSRDWASLVSVLLSASA